MEISLVSYLVHKHGKKVHLTQSAPFCTLLWNNGKQQTSLSFVYFITQTRSLFGGKQQSATISISKQELTNSQFSKA